MELFSKYKNNDSENLDIISTDFINKYVENLRDDFNSKTIHIKQSRFSYKIAFQFKKVYTVNIIEWDIFIGNEFFERIRKTIEINDNYVEIFRFRN